MKFSAQEEYGLRCLLRIAQSKEGLTIPEISRMEGLTTANVGKILRTLRLGGFIESTRGQNGGYKLSHPADEIIIGNVLTTLGGKLFESNFCEDHAGIETICTHTIDCSIRSLWKRMQFLLDGLLENTTLRDLLGTEKEVSVLVNNLSEGFENSKFKN